MPETALEIGFVPENAQAMLTIGALNHTLRAVQRVAWLTAAHSLGRDELTPAQQRDFQLTILDAHHSNLWLLLGTLGRNAADIVTKTVVEAAIHPLLQRLQTLLGKPEATSPIDAASLNALVQLARTAAESQMQIHLEAGSVRFTATPAAYQTLRDVPLGFRGLVMEIHGVVSEISLKRCTLTIDTVQGGTSVICRFSSAQALIIREVVLIGHPVTVRGYAYWTGEQISPTRPDVVEIEQVFDETGIPRLQEPPPLRIE